MAVATQLEPLSLEKSLRLDSRPQTPASRQFPRNASIVLIGSRGSGKRTLGFIGATHLGRRLITEDHYFQEATGVSRYGFAPKNMTQIWDMCWDTIFPMKLGQ